MKPFWKKKRFILLAVTTILGALGIPHAEKIVAIGDAAYTAGAR